MAQPDKEEKKDPEPAEILSDITDYQKRMEMQWESAKSSYEEKINNLLENFLEQTREKLNEEEEQNQVKNKKALSKFLKKDSDNQFESLFSQAEKALHSIEKKTKEINNKKPERARIMNVDWVTERQPRSRYKYLLFLAVVAAAAAGYFYFITVPQTSSLPYSHTAAIVVENDKIYIPDWFRKSLNVHLARRGLPIVSIEALPNDFLTGLAVSPNKIWTTNGITAQIYEHNRSVEHPVQKQVASPGKNPMGLYFDGTDLWSIDDIEKKIYRHKGNDIEEIKEVYPLPNLLISGFSLSDHRAWILNKKSRTLTIFRLGDPVEKMGTYDLDPFVKGSTPTGIFVEDSTVWITTENPSKLLKLSKRNVLGSHLQ